MNVGRSVERKDDFNDGNMRRRNASSEDRRRKILSARRRIIEWEVIDLIENRAKDDANDDLSGHDDDGGYEVIGGVRSEGDEEDHHYLTPIMRSDLIRQKSVSDTELLNILDEDREIEIFRLADDEDHEERVVAEDHHRIEQGFYRVYDDLERVRENDLIPYVITRKKRENEEKLKMQSDIEHKAEGGSAQAKVSDSRISLDSGRASIWSSGNTNNNRMVRGASNKRPHSDSGSSCSNDSGTYEVFDEHSDKESAKESSLPPPPPPPLPPKTGSQSHCSEGAGQTAPPPLPPRTKSNKTKCLSSSSSIVLVRRKDLSSFFGLLEDEPNQLLSKAVAKTVAREDLMQKSRKQASPYSNTTSPLLSLSPGRRKDLHRFLGFDDLEATEGRDAGNAVDSTNVAVECMPASSLLKRLSPQSKKPASNIRRKGFAGSSVRRELGFREAKNTANYALHRGEATADRAVSSHRQDQDDHDDRGNANDARAAAQRTPKAARRSDDFSRLIKKRRKSGHTCSLDKLDHDDDDDRGVRGKKSFTRDILATPTKVLMATFMRSRRDAAKSKSVSFADDNKENEDHDDDVTGASPGFAESVRVHGLPVIPFGHAVSTTERASDLIPPCAKKTSNLTCDAKEIKRKSRPESDIPEVFGTQLKHGTTSSLYLSMTGSTATTSRVVQALATPARPRANVCNDSKSNNFANPTARDRRPWPTSLSPTSLQLSVWSPSSKDWMVMKRKKKHCQSCTCHEHEDTNDLLDMEYVQMDRRGDINFLQF